jgi:hypothetical protein
MGLTSCRWITIAKTLADRRRECASEITQIAEARARARAGAKIGSICLGRPGRAAGSAVECEPADVVPQPLVVKDELANRFRELVALPPALTLSRGVGLSIGRGSSCSLDRIGGRTEVVCRDVCDGPGLTSGVSGMPCCPSQVSGRAHCMAARRTSLRHRDLTPRPGAGMLDRLTRSRIPRPSRLEQVENVLRARCRPQGQKTVIGIRESPAAPDRHEARVTDLRKDHGSPPAL